MLHAAFKYGSFADFLLYLEWLRYPSTMLLNSAGCTYDCSICGRSGNAYSSVVGRRWVGLRSPESTSPTPNHFFDLFRAARIPNHLVIEVLFPAGHDFFHTVANATKQSSLQLTNESPDQQIRRANGEFAMSNEAVEQSLAATLAEGCQRSTCSSSSACPARHRKRHWTQWTIADTRSSASKPTAAELLRCSTRGFLEQGSRAYEHREQLGYRRRLTTLAEHRAALLGPTWRDMLSYETDWMDRDHIVAAYEVGRRLNDLKLTAGLVDPTTHALVADHLDTQSDPRRGSGAEHAGRPGTAPSPARAPTSADRGQLGQLGRGG
jgi:hypothetical protein